MVESGVSFIEWIENTYNISFDEFSKLEEIDKLINRLNVGRPDGTPHTIQGQKAIDILIGKEGDYATRFDNKYTQAVERLLPKIIEPPIEPPPTEDITTLLSEQELNALTRQRIIGKDYIEKTTGKILRASLPSKTSKERIKEITQILKRYKT